MIKQADIVIIGGGLNGALTAIAASSIGLRSHIIDAAPQGSKEAEFDGRAYALALTSQRMLKVLGLWSDVAQHAQPILDIKVSDGIPGEGASPFHVHFDHAELDEGPMGHLLEDRYLRASLEKTVAANPMITQSCGVSLERIEHSAGSVTAHISDGSTLSAHLLIGADGRGSTVATLSGINRQGWEYNQASLVCAVEHDEDHFGTAHQFFTPSGPLAILPLPGHASSIVWTESKERAAEIHNMNDAEFLSCLRPVFGDFLGEVRLTGKRYLYPLGLSLAEQFVTDRIALVGDAAHGIHPLAGQGLNLGLRDIAALVQTLSEARGRGEDIGNIAVLERYQQWRRFDTRVMGAATDGINRLFSNDNPLARAARDIGLGIVGAVPGLRRGAMRHAAGLSGDMPYLMQGKAL